MATDGKVNRWDGVAYPAADERLLDSVLLMPGSSAAPFSGRGGRRVNGAGLAVSVGGGPEAWTCTAGAGVIYDPAYSALGPWRFEIPTAISATLPARPSTGQSRIDLIIARLYDVDSSVGAVKEVKIERVNGAAGASPSAPTTPDLSLILATVTVPATGTITVTPGTARAVAAGGILPVATTAERDALSPYRGLVVDNTQTGRLERYNGTAWVGLKDDDGVIIRRGSTVIPSGTGAVNVPVTIPGGALPGTNYTVTGTGTLAVITSVAVGTASKSTTGFTLTPTRSATGTYSVDWVLTYVAGS